jgi:hypothetical protein
MHGSSDVVPSNSLF